MNTGVSRCLVAVAILFTACGPTLPQTDVNLIKDTQGSLASMLEGADGGRVQVSTAQIKNAYCNTTMVLNDLKKNDSDSGIPCIGGKR